MSEIPALTSVDGISAPAVVGQGPRATVYRATWEATQQPVAVRVLKDPVLGDRRAPYALRCAAVVDVATHPAFADIVDTGWLDDGRPYLVTELAAGSFAGGLGNGPVAVAEVVAVGALLAEGLEAAHAASVVHGHVTPGNVMRFGAGPRLTDFGLDPAAGPVEGSPSFAAPETVWGVSPSTAGDVFGLCVTLYAALVGRAPRRLGTRFPDVVRLRELFDLPLPAVPGAPPGLVDVLRRGISYEPVARPTMADLRAALVEHRTALATPPVDVAPAAETHEPMDWRPVDPAAASSASTPVAVSGSADSGGVADLDGPAGADSVDSSDAVGPDSATSAGRGGSDPAAPGSGVPDHDLDVDSRDPAAPDTAPAPDATAVLPQTATAGPNGSELAPTAELPVLGTEQPSAGGGFVPFGKSAAGRLYAAAAETPAAADPNARPFGQSQAGRLYAASTGTPEATDPAARGRRRRLALVAGGLGIVVILAAGGWYSSRHTPRGTDLNALPAPAASDATEPSDVFSPSPVGSPSRSASPSPSPAASSASASPSASAFTSAVASAPASSPFVPAKTSAAPPPNEPPPIVASEVPPPADTGPDQAPTGYTDNCAGGVLQGWARDPDFTGSITVDVYEGGTFVGNGTANRPSEPAVGGNGAHRFAISLRALNLTSGAHRLTVYAIGVDSRGNLNGNNPPLKLAGGGRSRTSLTCNR